MAGAPAPNDRGEVERFPCSGESRELNSGGTAHRGVTSSHPCLLPALLAPAQFQVLSSSKFCFFFCFPTWFCFFYCFVHLRAAQNAAADPWAPAAAGRGGFSPLLTALQQVPADGSCPGHVLCTGTSDAGCSLPGRRHFPRPRIGSCNCHDSALL